MPRSASQSTFSNWLHPIIFICFYVSGAAGLMYEIVWLKALGTIFGRTIYAITAVLGAYMAGLAIGSWLLGRFAERRPNPLRLYGWIEFGIGLTGLASLAGLWLAQRTYIAMYPSLIGHAPLLLAFRFIGSSVVLLLPTTLMGGTYPVVIKYLTRGGRQLG